jgi:NAD(P)-dependent dehydrogenase (short-subunit alcohol dehydrogenase family)
MFDMTGRRAVVTGASSGIGQATAVLLAQAGADVASLHLPGPGGAETAAQIERQGRRALMVEGTTASADEVERFADRVERELGPIDVWVNNASRLHMEPFLEMTDESWDDLLGSNLKGYVHGCRAALRRMVPRQRGAIVNVSSITAIQSVTDMSAYITAKGGVVGLTQALAVEFGRSGIRINAVAPGATMTALTRDAYTPEVQAVYNARIALGRIAQPEDVARAVLFLASDGAGYVQGHQLVVDGGMIINGNVGMAGETV